MNARFGKYVLWLLGLIWLSSNGASAQNGCTVLTWGYNFSGQLGDYSLDNSSLPVRPLLTRPFLTGIAAISASDQFTLALKHDGTLWAWGYNFNGQLGNGATVKCSVPRQVKGPDGVGFLTDMTAASAGWAHSLALKSDGTVWSWGYNGSGQLGDGTTTQRSTPVQVKGPMGVGFLSNIVSIHSGYQHSIALKSDGSVWAWGYNENGQLGDGTTMKRTAPVQVKGPEGVGFLAGVVALSNGSGHSFALKSDGTVWSWGYNYFGQLGDGTTINRTTPVRVKGAEGIGFLTDVVSITGGGEHSIASKEDGTVWTWGLNFSGELGDGTTTNRSVPVQVLGPDNIGFLTNVISVAGGANHSLALKSDGTVWSWGWNGAGQLGDSTATQRNSPIQVLGTDSIDFLRDVVSVTGGNSHSLALKSDGTVWSWGYNFAGELGDGTNTDRNRPGEVKGTGGVGLLAEVISVNSGYNHSLALKSDGTVWSWGYNWNAQLGDGTDTNSSNTPVQVRGADGIGFLTDVIATIGGLFHSLALRSDGTVWTWGGNANGELGDGTTTQRNAPVQVKGPNGVGFLTKVISVAGNGAHSLALKSDGTVWSWGYNGSGQLGDGTTTQRSAPVQVKGPNGVGFLTDVVAVSARINHSLALKSDGTVWGWGNNGNGQLGDGTLADRTTPVQVKGVGGVGFLTDVFAISNGLYSSSVVNTDGTVWSWGRNWFGELGDGTTTPRTTPVQVKSQDGLSFLTNVVSISGGSEHSIVVQAEGAISGRVSLENASAFGIPVRFELRPIGGGETITRTVTLGVQGTFSLFDVMPGNYNVVVKGTKWLKQALPNVNTSAGNNVLNLRFFLRGGDANDDNSVDVLDLDRLIQAFDSTPFDAHWNEGADFDCNESVDVLDLDVLIRNFDVQGDA